MRACAGCARAVTQQLVAKQHGGRMGLTAGRRCCGVAGRGNRCGILLQSALGVHSAASRGGALRAANVGSLQLCRQPAGQPKLVCRSGERVRECGFSDTPGKWPARAAWGCHGGRHPSAMMHENLAGVGHHRGGDEEARARRAYYVGAGRWAKKLQFRKCKCSSVNVCL